MLLPQLPYWRERLAATAIQAGLIALAGICAVMLYQARLSAGLQALHEAESLTQVLHDGIEKNVEVAELALRNVDADLQLVEQHHLSSDVRDAIFHNHALPGTIFGALLVLDQSGRPIFLSKGTLPVEFDFSHQQYFVAHRDNPDRGVNLTLLASSPLSDGPVLLLTRRVNHVDGSFAGVAAEAIQPSLVETLFNSVTLEPDDDLLLNTSSGRVIFRRNFGTRFFNLDVSGSPVGKLLGASTGGFAKGPSVLDGVERLWIRRQLQSIGLTVIVGRSARGIYAVWRQQALLIAPAIAGLLIFAFILGFVLRRQLRHREQAEAALRASEAEFRLLSDAASDMVSRVDAQGKRTYVSPAVRRVLGMSAEAFLLTPVLDLICPQDRPFAQEVVAKLMAGESLREVNGFRVRRADGAERWIEAAVRPIKDPSSGAPDGYVASWRDVTDRKAAEQRLVESEERYRLLTESASDVITCLDLDLRRTYVSPASRAVLGYEPDELIGIQPARSIHPDDAPLVAERFRRISEGLFERDVLTNRIRHKAGHYIWVEAKITLMRDPATGQAVGILCVVRDISDRKAAADGLVSANRDLERLSLHLARARDTAERANEAKSRFLASVSHELRTPLNGIMGYAELLQIEGGLSDSQSARVDAMRCAGQHLLSMITGVLDLSEIETGRLDLQFSEVDLGVLASDCLALVRPLAQRRGLTLMDQPTDNSSPSPPRLMITTDATRLRQILVNLLGNAVKFTDHGGVAIRFSATERDRVRIEVADTGPGIPPGLRGRLFQEFDRLDGSTSRNVEGAGLGLALSHRLATALGGMIGYADNPGGGSIFWLALPVTQAGSAPRSPTCSDEAPAVPVAAPRAEFGSALRVLVVDDVEINRDIAASFLTSAGHQPSCAQSGEEGVAMAAAGNFDVVLMDVRMPGIDGREATRRIRALAGPRGQVPIVALTAQAFANEVAECRQAGMDDHLAKPFSQPALLSALSRAIESAAARPEPASPEPATCVEPLPLYGAELVVLDEATFRETAGYLTVQNVGAHVQNLIRRTEALLHGLGHPSGVSDLLSDQEEAVVEVAHSLAGSAGMFGFERLSAVARQYEFLVESGSADLPLMADSLGAAATASLVEMRRWVDLNSPPAPCSRDDGKKLIEL